MWIFAHRGAPEGQHRENSIHAFREALAKGAFLESDARLSSDGRPVLVHDRWIHMWPIWRRVDHLTAEQLCRRGVPALDEVYRAVGTAFEFSIDLKVAASGVPLIDVAVAHAAASRLWLVSDQLGLLERLRAASSDVRLVHEARRDEIGDARLHAKRLVAVGVDAQNTDAMDWDHELVDYVHESGLLAFGSLANDTGRLHRAASLRLDAIYTDDVRRAIDTLG